MRDRREDLPVLVNHFLNKAAKALGKRRPTPPPELIPLLSMYTFPGNVRELEALIFDAVSNHKSGKLSLAVFKAYITRKNVRFETQSAQIERAAPFWQKLSEKMPTLKQAEQLLIDEAMRQSQGNQSIAALSLGLSRQALNKRRNKKRSPP